MGVIPVKANHLGMAYSLDQHLSSAYSLHRLDAINSRIATAAGVPRPHEHVWDYIDQPLASLDTSCLINGQHIKAELFTLALTLDNGVLTVIMSCHLWGQ